MPYVSLTKRMRKLLSDHDVDVSEIDSLWAEYHNATMEYHRTLVDARVEMKQHINRDE